MNQTILDFVNVLEGWKTAIKSLHWNANSLSAHKECDEIADEISEFQDTVSEVEQGISGNLPYNKLKGKEYTITTISKFLEDVIKETTEFYKKLEEMGDSYIGLHSECESFLTKIQREVYLINFTLKEDFKRQYAAKINENKTFDINEDELTNVIQEAVHNTVGKMINEIGDTPKGREAIGAVNGRANAICNKECKNGQCNSDKAQKALKTNKLAQDEFWNNAPHDKSAHADYQKGYWDAYNKKMDEAIDKSIEKFLKTL